MGPRPRRMWRRVARVLLALFAVLVLAVGAVLLLLRTDWARDKVRGILVAQLAGKLRGTVEVKRLEGDLLDAVTLRGVVVHDAAGREVLRADSLTVDYRLMPLLDRHFHADLIAADGLQVALHRLPDGRLAIADLWIQQPPSGPPWTTTLDSIRVSRSAVALERSPGVWDRFERIEIDGAVALGTDDTRVTLASLDAEWKGPDAQGGVPLAAEGNLRTSRAAGLELAGVALSAGRAHVVVPAARWREGAGTAAIGADVSRDELLRLWPDSPLLADARLAGFVVRDRADGPVRAHLIGGAGTGALALWASLGADLSSGEVDVFWSGLEPDKLVRGAPPGRLEGWVAGTLAGLSRDNPRSLAALKANLRGGADGRLRGAPGETHLSFRADLDQLKLVADIGAAAPAAGSKAAVELRATLPQELDLPADIRIDRSSVKAEVKNLRPIASTYGLAPMSGAVTVNAEARGRLDDLTVRAHVASNKISQKSGPDLLTLTGVRVDADLQHVDVGRVPGPAVGTVEVHADQIAKGETSYGNAHAIASLSDGGRRAALKFNAGGRSGVGARGDLTARIEPDGARIRFGELRIATRDLVWQGRGGMLDVTQGGRRIAVDLSLASSAGSVGVSAELDRRGGDLRGPVRWQVSRLDLARVLAQLDRTGVSGQISTSGEVRLPEGPGRIQLKASKIAVGGRNPPLGGSLRADLSRRRLDVQADLDAGAIGRLTARAVLRTPARLTDGAAWKRLGTGAVELLAAKGEKLDVARALHTFASASAGRRLQSGLADLELEAGPGLASGKLSVRLTGAEVLATTQLVVPVRLDLQAELAASAVKTSAHVDAGDHGKLELDADVALPGQPLDGAAWRRQGVGLIRSASVRLRDFNLARLQPPGKNGVARRSLELTGTVQAEVKAGPAARALEAVVSFADVRIIDLASPLSGRLTVAAQPSTTDVSLDIRLPGGPLVDGALSVRVGSDQVRGLDFAALPARLRRAPLSGRVRIPDQPVLRLAAALDAHPKVSGHLSGELTATGTLARPVVAVQLNAPGFTAQGIRFDLLQARGTYRAGPWNAAVDARQSDGGRVALRASGAARSAPLKVHLFTSRLHLGLFEPLWKRPGGTLTYLNGQLNANLDISGTPRQPVIEGQLRLRDGEARIAQFLRPVTALRADVVFRGGQGTVDLQANSRPGKMRLAGNFDVRRLAQARWSGTLTATRLPVDVGKQIVAIEGKVEASGQLRGPMWDVNVLVKRGLVVRLPSQKGLVLHDSGPLEDVVYVDAAGAAQEEARKQLKKAAGPAMRLRIKSEDLIQVRSDELRLELRVRLTMTQVGGVNVLDGSVEARRGWIEIVGRRYDVERAWILFAGEIPLDPRLDIRVGHQFTSALVYIDVTGRMSDPQVSFASDSGNYDQAQLLGMILGGEQGQTQSTLSERASGAAVNVVASQVAGMIRQAGLPVDALQYGREEGDTQAQFITVGKWLTDRLFVAYRLRETNDVNKNRNEATFQHFFTRNWMWEGTTGDRGATSVDLLWIVPLGR